MQLIHHAYSSKPDRYFIDSRRVSQDTFQYAQIKARIAGQQHCAFFTRRRNTAPGHTHYVHYSSIH
jgi:hypothetical protein